MDALGERDARRARRAGAWREARGVARVASHREAPQRRSAAQRRSAWTDGAAGTFLADPHWWRRGEHYISVDPAWIVQGDNRIELRFHGDDFETSWIDLLIDYEGKQSVAAAE